MSQAQQAQPTFQPPKSHTEFNAHLARLNLPTLTSESIKKLQETESNERLFSALARARLDKNSFTYLENVIIPLSENPVQQSTPVQPQSQSNQTAPVTNINSHAQRHAPVASNDSSRTNTSKSHHSNANHNSDSRGNRENNYLAHHVYGGKAALCFNATKYRDRFTITMDGAPNVSPKKYNWPQKTSVTLTQSELPQVASVLLGLLPQCEFNSHGPNKDKGFKLVNQKGSIFVNLFEKNKPLIAVPVTASDVYFITNLFLKQLMGNQPWLTHSGIIDSLRHSIMRLEKSK